MTPESRAFLEAVQPPEGAASSPLTEQCYEAVEPFHKLAADFRTQLAAMQLLLARSDRAETDVGVYGKFERFKQTFGAIDRELASVTRAAQALTDAAWQLDRYARETQDALTTATPAP